MPPILSDLVKPLIRKQFTTLCLSGTASGSMRQRVPGRPVFSVGVGGKVTFFRFLIPGRIMLANTLAIIYNYLSFGLIPRRLGPSVLGGPFFLAHSANSLSRTAIPGRPPVHRVRLRSLSDPLRDCRLTPSPKKSFQPAGSVPAGFFLSGSAKCLSYSAADRKTAISANYTRQRPSRDHTLRANSVPRISARRP